MTSNQDRKSSDATDPVAFLVRFANADLGQYREGDWLNLQDDLEAFGRSELAGCSFCATDEQMSRAGVDRKAFRSLQNDLREILRPIAVSQSVIDPRSRFGKVLAQHSDLSSSSSSYSRDIGQTFLTIDVNAGKTPRLEVSAKYRELIFVKAALLLLVVSSPEQARLRVCPECGAMFLRIRKQVYCGRRCVNRANMREWLGRPRRKAQHQDSSRRSYAKRVRARTNGNVKIGRRAKR
jgi:hypothetical protein